MPQGAFDQGHLNLIAQFVRDSVSLFQLPNELFDFGLPIHLCPSEAEPMPSLSSSEAIQLSEIVAKFCRC